MVEYRGRIFDRPLGGRIVGLAHNRVIYCIRGVLGDKIIVWSTKKEEAELNTVHKQYSNGKAINC